MSEGLGTVSVFAVRAFAGALAQSGVDSAALLTEVGLPPSVLDDADLRVPATLAFRAFQEAAARTGDPCFAVHAAERVPFGAVGFLDYHARSSPTLGEALRRVIRYFALANDRMVAALEIDGADASIVQRRRSGAPVPGPLAEFQLAMIVVRGRLFTGREWPMRAVTFAHAAPADGREHERFFRAPVSFGAPADALVFAREFLDAPLPTADPTLSSVLERYGEGLIARLPAGDSLLDDARRAVAGLLRSGDASLEATASRLGTSRRTLQRRLKELGTSQKDVVDDVRRELALRWLADARVSITEATYLLGFSEPAAFHRAFKRWTGQTASEYRRAHR